MNLKYPYALYLDSKILGTAKQLISFYEQGIFSIENTIIYLKKYKQSSKSFSKLFKAKGIPFQFMKPKDLDILSGQTIFYAFNAQSNCRFVANRNLKHIFITHGESNKVASIKPIIRIYDHVVMAGELSLERYYRSGLFDEHDYQTGRLIMMGDTFIGKTGFNLDKSGEPVLLYAPTWEGGLENENYSSLQNIKVTFENILQQSKNLECNSILIKAHPNTGHRIPGYKKYLVQLAILLAKEGLKVYINNINFWIGLVYYLRVYNIRVISNIRKFKVLHSFLDLSAIESQCLNENITYNIFYSKHRLREDIPQSYLALYKIIGISIDEISVDKEKFNVNPNIYKKIRNELFFYDIGNFDSVRFENRVEQLVKYIDIKSAEYKHVD